MNIKQAIIIRKDLKMRRGKEIVQGSHASMKFLAGKFATLTGLSDIERQWLFGIQKKICFQCDSERELLLLYHNAQELGLTWSLIEDLGLTEFNEPTYTALAIGPDLI